MASKKTKTAHVMPESVRLYTNRIGAEQLSFKRYMVKDLEGGHYYTERAVITISSDGSVTCTDPQYAPTKEEAARIVEDWKTFKKPEPIRSNETKFKELRALLPKTSVLFPIYVRPTDGSRDVIAMVQERKRKPDGSKAYIPWTLFNDGEWRPMEPDGDLPFFKPKAKTHNKIMVHEGAKAAQIAAEIADDHPWHATLSEYEHWGILGGAKAPHRADYAELIAANPTNVVYVADNDFEGRVVPQRFSERYGKAMSIVMFDEAFPPTFDIGDDIPKSMFKNKLYTGPMLEDLMQPGTFATEYWLNPETERKSAVLKDVFSREWYHSINPELFIHKSFPGRTYCADEFNSMVRPFAYVANVAGLLRAENANKVQTVAYMPDKPQGVIATQAGKTVNIFQPSPIRPRPGNPSPFLDYMSGLFPLAEERAHVLKWVATLIACPGVRMTYSVLVISETQGVGKSTLGEKILAPLVGRHNTSFPTDATLDSDFNSWAANKRLVVVNEIYQGGNAKMYTKLKSVMTDQIICVNEKFQKPYDSPNWCHLYACSNSTKALKIDSGDRRWLVPKASEEVRSSEYWRAFNAWLSEGDGLAIIAQWAADHVAEHGCVKAGEHAPNTEAKRQLRTEGYSVGQIAVHNLLSRIEERIAPNECIVIDTDLSEYVQRVVYNGKHSDRMERVQTLRSVARDMGWNVGGQNSGCPAWGIGKKEARVISPSKSVIARTPSELHKEGRNPLKLQDFETM